MLASTTILNKPYKSTKDFQSSQELVLKLQDLKHDWTLDQVLDLYNLPFRKLLSVASTLTETYFPEADVQLCTLLSVKTGGCKEDCAYCPQSAHYKTSVNAEGLLDVNEITEQARLAKERGASRFCMGAAWRRPPKNSPAFKQLLDSIEQVSSLGLEVCTTLGMLDEDEAVALKKAGVHAYNHNLDTSREFYPSVITTRTYDDRLTTLRNVRKAGMTVCCGGIIGMGEQREDRAKLLLELAFMNPHPESVPVNLLVQVEGTPLAERFKNESQVDNIELARTIAVARILMPKSRVRLSAGREQMSEEAQTLCFSAGANSIFVGDKLLTTPNPAMDEDIELLRKLGMLGTASPSLQ